MIISSSENEVDPTRPNSMEIDLGALECNFQMLQGIVGPNVQILPCVKNAAYGLGVQDIVRKLSALGVTTFTCGTLEDALAIRSASKRDTDIVVFGSALPIGISTYLDLGFIPTVHTMEIAAAVSAYAKGPTRVYIKVDAGRGRLGFPLRTAEEAILTIAGMSNIVIDGVYTHLPFSNAEEAGWAQERTNLFDALIGRLRSQGLAIPVTQARSSTGVLHGILDECNSVCLGRALLGYPPRIDGMKCVGDFRPVLTAIRSRLIHISPNAADQTPGLSGKYAGRVTGATGVIPFGRKDGNKLGYESFVIVQGRKAPVLSVSSEQAVIDLSNIENPRTGDDVVLLGRSGRLEITLDDIADWQGCSIGEILLAMRGRVKQFVRQ